MAVRRKEGLDCWRRMAGKNPLGGEEVRQPPERQNPSIREGSMRSPLCARSQAPYVKRVGQLGYGCASYHRFGVYYMRS